MCLYDGKSYKDLKPKQIAKLYKHYANLKQDIRQTRPDDINKFIDEWDYETYRRKINKGKPIPIVGDDGSGGFY